MRWVAKIKKIVTCSLIWGSFAFVGHAFITYINLGVVNVDKSIVAGVVFGLLSGWREWRAGRVE